MVKIKVTAGVSVTNTFNKLQSYNDVLSSLKLESKKEKKRFS